MKKYLSIAFLILAVAYPVYARWSIGIVGGVVPAAPAGDSCTGGLLFSWHTESTDVTSGSPAGCSVGDTTGTVNSAGEVSTTQKHDGSNSVYLPTTSDYYTFSVSDEDIVKGEVGQATFWMYPNVADTALRLLCVYRDATNYIDIFSHAINVIRVSYTTGGSAVNCTTSVTTTNNAWNFVKVSWSVAGESGNYLRVGVGSDENPTMVNCTSAISDFGAPTELIVGDPLGSGTNVYIDEIKVRSAW